MWNVTRSNVILEGSSAIVIIFSFTSSFMTREMLCSSATNAFCLINDMYLSKETNPYSKETNPTCFHPIHNKIVRIKIAYDEI